MIQVLIPHILHVLQPPYLGVQTDASLIHGAILLLFLILVLSFAALSLLWQALGHDSGTRPHPPSWSSRNCLIL